jgi:micrococcal nuclease
MKMQGSYRVVTALFMGAAVVPFSLAQEPAPAKPAQAATTNAQQSAAKAQPRPFGQRVKVDPAAIKVEDGDGVVIRWGDKDEEIVRVLGIDTPEVRRLEHNLPYDQPFGLEAKAFGQGAFAAASDVEMLRSSTLDPYGRTLAYLFINGRNYSVLVIKAKFSTETVSHYGDNGLRREAAEVMAAAKEVGSTPLPFEPPHQYRARMRAVTTALKQSGQFPAN